MSYHKHYATAGYCTLQLYNEIPKSQYLDKDDAD